MRTPTRPYKLVARQAAEIHRAFGGSLTMLNGVDLTFSVYPSKGWRGFNLVMLPPESSFTLRKEGRGLTARDLREFFYESRHQRMFRRDRAVLYTAYDEDKDESIAGLGALVPERVANRLKDLRPEVEVVEGAT